MSRLPRLPHEPVQRLLEPLNRFLHVEAASGVVLLAAALVALAFANSPAAEGFAAFWDTSVSFRIGAFEMDHSLKHWVSDGLMAIFFFVVGLEVKRELALGELRDPRQATLPLLAAIGGMAVPALLYLVFTWGTAASRGWGIPMATDIAFVVGCMALLGERVPRSLRVLVLSIAIVDDIGAILAIAIGYTADLNGMALALGLGGIGLVVFVRWIGVRAVSAYVPLGVFVWVAFHESGVHATLAGVILGMITPARSWVGESRATQILEGASRIWRGEEWNDRIEKRALARRVETALRETVSPLERLETAIHPWSAFVIMPVFALANAGVTFEASLLADPVALAVSVGLVLGKPIGIVLASAVAVGFGLAQLPAGVEWRSLAGGGCLAGIGFTMSLFIANLALAGDPLDAARGAVLVASGVSGAIGMALLLVSPRVRR